MYGQKIFMMKRVNGHGWNEGHFSTFLMLSCYLLPIRIAKPEVCRLSGIFMLLHAAKAIKFTIKVGDPDSLSN